MREWIEQFKSSSRETKWFIFNWAVYGLLTILSFVYCYWRIVYLHPYEKPPKAQELPKP